MNRGMEERRGWQRKLALLIAAASVLAALIALRGPDQISVSTAGTTGAWLLSGPSAWSAQTIFGIISTPAYALAGPRGWQNLHAGIAWLAILCWLIPLATPAWRGMTPLIPALLAAVLSVPAAGLSGFGLAVLVLSAWRLIACENAWSAATFQAAAWLAAWLSPGALPVIFALALERSPRWPRSRLVPAWAAMFFVINLTPRGLSIWGEAWVFLRWSPEAMPSGAAIIALLLNVAALALALRWSLARRCTGMALAPAMLLLCASQGQAAFLWASALMMIPLWQPAKEQLLQLGVRVRWWATMTLLIIASLLALWRGSQRYNEWFDLAMERETAQPTLTRDALLPGGNVYINPQGLTLARFAGPLPQRSPEGETLRLPREPRLWRAQDRRARYRAVWLLGDKADYAPLARHLGESPDWRLAAVDATGLLFVREPGGREFATEPAQDLARGLVGAANKSQFLLGAALSCLAAQAFPEAGELSRTAVRKSDDSSASAAARALVLVSLGQVTQALEQSLRAVQLAPESAAAWMTRTEALLHAGRTDDAYAAGQRAAELAPGDAGALWLAARSANAARAFQSEAEILEQLIALTRGRGGDDSFYQLYLGQAYAKQGLTRPALRALETTAAAPGLSDEQRRELQEEIGRIKQNAGER